MDGNSVRVQEILDALDTMYCEDPDYLPEAMALLNHRELGELAFAFAKRAGVAVREPHHVSAANLRDR